MITPRERYAADPDARHIGSEHELVPRPCLHDHDAPVPRAARSVERPESARHGDPAVRSSGEP